MFLTLKIMDFENVALIKVVYIYVMEAMNTKKYDIKSTCSRNIFIFNMQCKIMYLKYKI
jgi:hypothetical protein